MFNSERRKHDELMRRLKASVYLLDDECTILDMQGGTVWDTEEEKKLKESQEVKCDWAVWYWMSLFVGIILLIISLVWFLHM